MKKATHNEKMLKYYKNQTKQLEEELARIKSSISWYCTIPLRKAVDFAKKIKTPIRSFRKNNAQETSKKS
jgi:hypothetical protein